MGGAALPVGLIGSSLINALGNSAGPNTNTAVPPDLAGARSSQIGLLQQLLGGQGGGGMFGNLFGGQGQQQGSALDRLQSYFGNYSVPQTDLQRQSAGGISQMLTQGSPYEQTINKGYSALQAIMSPTNNPLFEQSLSLANQQGGRFSSGNELLRGQAVTGMFGLANQAAQTANLLGQGQANILGQGYGIGQQQAGQQDIQTQRTLQLLGGLLGLRQQLVGGLPITQTPNLGQSLGGAGMGVTGLLGLLGYLRGGGAGGGTGGTAPNYGAGSTAAQYMTDPGG